jgi:hypothetical protein
MRSTAFCNSGDINFHLSGPDIVHMAFADPLEAVLEARGFEPLIDRTEIYAFEDCGNPSGP